MIFDQFDGEQIETAGMAVPIIRPLQVAIPDLAEGSAREIIEIEKFAFL